MFRRFFDEGLAQSSYLIAADGSREAVVIDPRRDVDAYIEAATQHGITIVYTIETHIHADFVSGARELAAIGARPIAGPGAGLGFDHHQVRDGERIDAGGLQLDFLHTPGHTPEHISIVVRQPAEPVRVMTGDTLFVGAVGRPDLLGEELMRQLAGQLHDSLFQKLLVLEDGVEVHPGHGAGSLCGAGIGNAPHSTIAQERRFNPMLQHRTRDDFIKAVLADLPETPSYFPRTKRVNREGPPVLSLARGVPALPAIPAKDAAAMVRGGALMLDLRTADEFGAGHPPGALNIGFGLKVGYWAGWVVPPDTDVVLLTGSEVHAASVTRQLLRVGIDRVKGVVHGGLDAWRAARLAVEQLKQINVRDLYARVQRGERLVVVDVRSRREWQGGRIEKARNIPVGEVESRLGEIERGAPIATICEGGFRSSLAASILARAGFGPLVNVTGGMSAYRALEART